MSSSGGGGAMESGGASKNVPATTTITPNVNGKLASVATLASATASKQPVKSDHIAATPVIVSKTGGSAAAAAAAASDKLRLAAAENNNDSAFQVQVSPAGGAGERASTANALGSSESSSSPAAAAGYRSSSNAAPAAGQRQPSVVGAAEANGCAGDAGAEMDERAARDNSSSGAAAVESSSSPSSYLGDESSSAQRRASTADRQQPRQPPQPEPQPQRDEQVDDNSATSPPPQKIQNQNNNNNTDTIHGDQQQTAISCDGSQELEAETTKRPGGDKPTTTTTTTTFAANHHIAKRASTTIEVGALQAQPNEHHHHHDQHGSDISTLAAKDHCFAAPGDQDDYEANYDHDDHQKQQQQQARRLEFLYTSKRPAPKRLGYFQSLLLRKWPCLAISICIMSSLIFGMLLSALTIYLMHDVTDCGGQLAMVAAAAAAAASHNPGPGAAHLMAAPTNHHNHDPGQHHQHHHQHQSVNLLPRELMIARPAASEFGLETPVESAGAGPVGPVDPADLVGRRLLAAAGLAGANDTGSPTTAAAAAQNFQRLPTSLEPEHYDLFVWPQLVEPFTFNGTLEILIKCRANTRNVTLHTHDVTISEPSISLSELADKLPGPGDELSRRLRRSSTAAAAAAAATPAIARASRQLKVLKLTQDSRMQYSIIELDQELQAGRNYSLKLNFVGFLNDELAGFYKIKYELQNTNETTWIAATQFQATDARRAFPCFDEPSYKATFSIKIRHWTNMTALSNMPIVSSERSPDGAWITDTFAKTHRMSTYLVAWTVTNFESRSEGNISVWTRPGFSHTAEYALQIAGKILRHYEQFFGIEYPLPKMDMIALPDFNAGAMENWGLITYRETAMLYDPNSSSLGNKQRVATVVSHELAHQWFGNLVSPKWWDDLWLNEGFASYVEYIGVHHVHPTWRMLEQFVVDELQNVFKMDALSSSHQISVPVNNPDEIGEIFDHISYAKGASIIRMMNYFLTEEVFKLGLRRYLRALKYKNAEQSDLWAHLTDAQLSLQQQQQQQQQKKNSSLTQTEMVNVERVMNSWTLQTGYPLVTLTRDYSGGAGAPIGSLDQVRYQPYKLAGINDNTTSTTAAAAANKQRWEVPITFTWKSEQNWHPTTRLWMHQNQTAKVEVSRSLAPTLRSDEWILLNVQQAGFYRVNYDKRNWRLLVEQLLEDHTQIGPMNRAQLLDDMFEMAQSSQLDYPLVLGATKYLKQERDYLPWSSVLLAFGYIDDMLARTPIYGAWQDYFSQLLAPYYARYQHIEWTTTTAATTAASKQVTPSNQTNTISDSEDIIELYNQVNAALWSCEVGNPHAIQRAKAAFAEWRAAPNGQNVIKPALRYATYCTAISQGGKDEWDFLWSVYVREQSATERDRILRALACTRQMWLLSRYLEWVFDKTKPIRRQDGSYVFRVIAKNNYGRDIAFNFVRERWPVIREFYGKASFSMGHLVKSLATSMNTPTEVDQLKAFYESVKHDLGTGKRAFQIAIEEAEGNVQWRARNYKILDDWLQSQQKPAAAA